MNTRYLIPGLSALLLAVVFPAYWIPEFAVSYDSFEAHFWNNVATLNYHDSIFVVIGLLAAYICYALMGKLHDELNYKTLDPLLWILIAVNLLFTGTIGIDITAAIAGDELAAASKDALMSTALVISLGCTIVFGVLDIIIGIILVRSGESTPTILKLFGAVTIIQGLCELVFFFVFAVVFIYPVALILLAIYFLRTPETIEVV